MKQNKGGDGTAVA